MERKPEYLEIPLAVRRLLSGHGRLYNPPLAPMACPGPEPGACPGCDADAELLAAWQAAEASTPHTAGAPPRPAPEPIPVDDPPPATVKAPRKEHLPQVEATPEALRLDPDAQAFPFHVLHEIIKAMRGKAQRDADAAAGSEEKVSASVAFTGIVSALQALDSLAGTLTPKTLPPQVRESLITSRAMMDVLSERERQDAKFGEQNLDPFHYHAVLSEEHGEYAQAVLHTVYGGEKGGLHNMRKEALHVAAVALSIVECLDRGKWQWQVSPDLHLRADDGHKREHVRANVATEDAAALADCLAGLVGSNDPAHLRLMRAEIQLHPEEHGGEERTPLYLQSVETLLRFRERQATARVESTDAPE